VWAKEEIQENKNEYFSWMIAGEGPNLTTKR